MLKETVGKYWVYCLYLHPAYGRKYLTKEAALNDWTSGKDFIVRRNGMYTSVRDYLKLIELSDEIYLVYGKDNEKSVKL